MWAYTCTLDRSVDMAMPRAGKLTANEDSKLLNEGTVLG
jgi:hypothetical protein